MMLRGVDEVHAGHGAAVIPGGVPGQRVGEGGLVGRRDGLICTIYPGSVEIGKEIGRKFS